MSFTEVIAQAYLARVQLWSDGFYATPGLHWDAKTMRGHPFSYFSYGAAVSEVVRLMAPAVVHIRYEVGEDWSGDWAIFFRVLLSDEASQGSNLRDVTTQVVERISELLDFTSMGIHAYYNFRSQSEQAELREPAWA